MAFFSFLGHIITSILLGYLAFTNMLADSIERLIEPAIDPAAQTAPHQAQPDSAANPNASAQFTSLGTRSGTIPRILIDSTEYQRAAIGAAAGIDEEVVADQTIPLEKRVKDALVNVFCQYKTPEYIRTTTGTGFFISHKGVILTNAHVAQFLLLRELDDSIIDARCVIRSGDPASPKYEAELLYISPAWILENADLIANESPRGTGERDYALLYVSKSVDSTPLPARFPALPVDTALLPRSTSGITVMTAGYPAEALIRNGARAQLYPKSASTTVGELYTFGSNYADIFSVSDSPVGEHGVSGGPIVRDSGSVMGLIVTKGDDRNDGAQSLRALTLSYVDRTITDETGYSLTANMLGDVAYRGKIFNSALAPFLTQLLSFELRER